jgi:putative hydrolase of the HAD superfamily
LAPKRRLISQNESNTMATQRTLSALMLDFGCVISKTMFENMELVERGLGLDAGTLPWRGPFNLDSDPLYRDMLADRITERQYWATRAAEVGALVGEQWDTRGFYDRACDICGLAWFRSEFVELLDDARHAGIRTGILTNELELFHGADWVEAVPALQKIDVIVDATHTKILKPDPQAYQLGLEALKAAPEETLFVDDQIRNVRGAEAVGIPALHFDVRRPAEMMLEIRKHLALPLPV